MRLACWKVHDSMSDMSCSAAARVARVLSGNRSAHCCMILRLKKRIFSRGTFQTGLNASVGFLSMRGAWGIVVEDCPLFPDVVEVFERMPKGSVLSPSS